MTSLPRGPLVADVAGLALDATERERLVHPLVGGVILFARNYASREQVTALVAAIHALRDPPLVVSVDHEGGRVQRFRDGFTAIPAMRTLGERWERDIAGAIAEATRLGYTLASELRAVGIDHSYAPVLDIDHGHSAVIGDRALAGRANAVASLARALVDGLHAGGTASVGKHFPGHGFAGADSHLELPRDPRPLEALVAADLVPFAALASQGLDAMMPAHIVYTAIDDRIAGFSSYWLRDVLRGRLGFRGLVFSDDLSMAGARAAGDVVARAEAATLAGCDVVLLCNDPASVDELLDRWRPPRNDALAARWAPMQGRAVGRCPA